MVASLRSLCSTSRGYGPISRLPWDPTVPQLSDLRGQPIHTRSPYHTAHVDEKTQHQNYTYSTNTKELTKLKEDVSRIYPGGHSCRPTRSILTPVYTVQRSPEEARIYTHYGHFSAGRSSTAKWPFGPDCLNFYILRGYQAAQQNQGLPSRTSHWELLI